MADTVNACESICELIERFPDHNEILAFNPSSEAQVWSYMTGMTHFLFLVRIQEQSRRTEEELKQHLDEMKSSTEYLAAFAHAAQMQMCYHESLSKMYESLAFSPSLKPQAKSVNSVVAPSILNKS